MRTHLSGVGGFVNQTDSN